jgi:hypothetical protein
MMTPLQEVVVDAIVLQYMYSTHNYTSYNYYGEVLVLS